MISVDEDDRRLLAAASATIRESQLKLQSLSAEARLLYQQRFSEWEQCRHSLEEFAALLNSQIAGIGLQQSSEPESRANLMQDEAQLREKHNELAEKVYRLQQTVRLLVAATRCLENESKRLLENGSPSSEGDNRDSQADWADRILQAREQERLRLAREIHDGPAQVLANAVFELEYLQRVLERDPGSINEHLAQLRSDLRHGLTEVRRYIFNLRAPSLSDMGLFVAFRHYLDEFGRHFGIDVESNLPEGKVQISATKEMAIFRVFQEALQNVQKHADASRVAVTGRLGPSALEITIEDNGRGFDLEGVQARQSKNLGLTTMRERAELIGAQLTIAASPGQGTRVVLVVPLERGAS